ncbi:carbohydrate ABC transporter permease [Lacticaseibacillus yichunensis]|uniref:Carbohydrate ABC transporter permease n=1 Tax=Lacticaseibacillus yichunensis TaxID=2486015 RepID=A0ABW4CP16_9LACO|nr:carbohydrate ABC transporter permease [Lacticaseibacillus yichunensis]
MRSLKWIKYAFLYLMVLAFVLPMLFTFISSFKNNNEIFSAPFSLPKIWRFENWQIAWSSAGMSRYLLNSFGLAIGSVALILIVASMVAYEISRFNFRINKLLLSFFLMGMMIPMHAIIVPISWIIGNLDLKNNIGALMLLYIAFAMPFTTAVLANFMRAIPVEIEEAAVLDGASKFAIYLRVILPMSGPALSTVAIFNFLSVWNDVMFPLLFINDPSMKTVALGLLNFSGEHGTDYGPMMAAISITISVPFILYIFFQERIENGIAAGAIKG